MAQDLIAKLGFITHRTYHNNDQWALTQEWESVPPEDPDEWEDWTRGGYDYGGGLGPQTNIVSGRRRKG